VVVLVDITGGWRRLAAGKRATERVHGSSSSSSSSSKQAAAAASSSLACSLKNQTSG
jgi:hypothetical protein